LQHGAVCGLRNHLQRALNREASSIEYSCCCECADELGSNRTLESRLHSLKIAPQHGAACGLRKSLQRALNRGIVDRIFP
jgi:hypothetical protein